MHIKRAIGCAASLAGLDGADMSSAEVWAVLQSVSKQLSLERGAQTTELFSLESYTFEGERGCGTPRCDATLSLLEPKSR